ncbi:MAG: hypothetical protein UX99_C0008G0020 [Candidatus Amesbacteria bacterium GW2011_GWB1_47_26]|uniref:Uncharacterized protein n=1 Tax=Candidatus Amesbacteria bacterium GW2011_GWC2_45_19 TaxID=1618366 RepID=A0A0G1PC98_9BACT|nr:MAG: hypothetical protein UX05_C0004G0032 [Candidatus Amesbacteria bacterium GW2011_GWC2_45_19]KKU38518.1 MAG: hypothetical protein UX52_C0005G0030 [Candidatus Amesbacteria bacterium GW2011_GWA1_46_35]KKU69193.1 MAG: hypothetical protein UX93_C0002G0032 [Microgenomates group bacterium GW2011_GWC1_47_20]KKU74686.1 MAG: hypothetical protein UX99_C0008G0020 [Candidatus Amesbacteria bacterium GW2011_GWB1_47_26]KKU80126.1 MAG: hypothetical protein UY06_C0005G0011 [Candidatus Amesbacteria bacteriu
MIYFYLEAKMENQIRVGDQNTQQIGQDPASQPIQIPKKSKLNYWLVSTVLLLVILLIGAGWFIWNLKSKNQIIVTTPTQVPNLIPTAVTGTVIPEVNYFTARLLDESEKIAFVKDNEIWTSDIDGKNTKRLIAPTSSTYKPSLDSIAWSPDGTKIIFFANYDVYESNLKISPLTGAYIYDSLSSKIYFMGRDGILDFFNSWSWDGKMIALLTDTKIGNGELKIINLSTWRIKTIPLNTNQRRTGPMYWDKENRIYFITYIPITYCNTVTSNCQIENETKKSSTNSIVRIDINNPNNLQAVFTRKFTDGGITNFFINPQRNTTIVVGNEGYNNAKIKVFEVDLNSLAISELPTGNNWFGNEAFETFIRYSFDKKHAVIVSAAGPSNWYSVVNLSDNNFSDAVIKTSPQYIFEGWYSADQILVTEYDSGKQDNFLININTLQKQGFVLDYYQVRIRPF